MTIERTSTSCGWSQCSRREGPERGSVSLELVVLAPALLLLIALLTFAGRHAIAAGTVDQAAADAARAASLQRTSTAGRDAGTKTARQSLNGQRLSCRTVEVDVDTSGFAFPVGRPAQVSVTVTCQLSVADLALPIPPTTVTATAVSPIDTYRERR